ncbi:MAG: serine/threonine protein kinase [Gemmataceae bacterium]|nr:serine/threonine protein kinase [Gemmataceae bacterium]
MTSTTAADLGADSLRPDSLRPAQEPDELGPYRILRVLGHGGMGVVYLAEDPKLQRRIALKVMHPRHAGQAQARLRFLREARTQAALEHEHIVAIYHVDEDNGVPFIAMPLLRGETLADRLKRERTLPLGEALRIGREIAEGLAAAHRQGIVHRDIKPSNIWLEGQRARAKILDFGLARAAETSDDSQITYTGAVLGTPAYMSPEQARGGRVDGRSDVFSLGVVLYQAITGELPFKGSTTFAILSALALDEPMPPHNLNNDVPAWISDAIVKMLAKKPDDRCHSASAVALLLAYMEHVAGAVDDGVDPACRAGPSTDASRMESATTPEAQVPARPRSRPARSRPAGGTYISVLQRFVRFVQCPASPARPSIPRNNVCNSL